MNPKKHSWKKNRAFNRAVVRCVALSLLLVLGLLALFTSFVHPLLGGMCLAAAAITPINTAETSGEFYEGLVVDAGATLYIGVYAALNPATGNVVPASDTAGLIPLGRVEAWPNVDTFTAGMKIHIKRGVFVFTNSIANPLGLQNIGKMALIEDDQTVASATANNIGAGRLLGFLDGDLTQPIIDTRARPNTENALPA